MLSEDKFTHLDLDMRSAINGQGHQSSFNFAPAYRCNTYSSGVTFAIEKCLNLGCI
jgi:hypothetical protein